MLKEKLLHCEQVIDRLHGTFLSAGSGYYVVPDFVKRFSEIVPPEYVKEGWDYIKEYFQESLPNLLSTNYAGFWFFVAKLCYQVEDRKLASRTLYKLNNLYVFIFFNSLIKKFFPHGFDYKVWSEAIQRSKSRYMKQGFESVADLLGKDLANKMSVGKYSKGTIGELVKAYYELRHRVSQIVKPIVVIYYRLKTIEAGARDGTDTVSHVFLVWFKEILRDNRQLKQYLSKTISNQCKDKVDLYVDRLKNADIFTIEYILRNVLRGVKDTTFWLADEKMRSLWENLYFNEEFTEQNVVCFLEILYNIYKFYLLKRAQ